MVSFDSFNGSRCEPNWLDAQKSSYIDWIDGNSWAFLDRWGYKARDNRDCNIDYDTIEDYLNLKEFGYSHEWYTDQMYEDDTDPTYGMDPISQGPYFIDQDDMGWFQFHGPEVYAPGPRMNWRKERIYDDTLWFRDLRPSSFSTIAS